ncbi:MAG: tRNA glutamyl-Q(34) synthetase GluQRS [Paracoccaceae bacterium]|nr:tRNA glutamyl-Q(34) synthetase GluQRS [Paracoccaceae bacterium]MDG2259148.1 tRNA glutamyl-Q(34) synthetase GluQRS [Paracoccaceae bacterium]
MKTRFAPSPTGPLHLGHAYSALYASDLAEKNQGEFLLRIEDIDQARAQPKWEQQIYEDLSWLGIRWVKPVLRQSSRLDQYRSALQHLDKMGLIYNCTCSRRDIQEAANAPQEGSSLNLGPDGIVYSGKCRQENAGISVDYTKPIRLNAQAAFNTLKSPLNWVDNGAKSMAKDKFLTQIGDIVLSRKNMGTSYHLSVVVDDAYQGITDVVRGKDLAEATAIHVLLQRLLEVPTPSYHHHGLIRDENGTRLAKRDDAKAIALFRQNGTTPDEIRRFVGLPQA